MNSRNIWLIVGAVLVIAIIVAGIQRARRQSSSHVVRLGVILSLTGTVGDYGQRSLNGIRLAVDEINSRGGVDGKRLLIEVEDAQSEPKNAVSAYQKLVGEDGLTLLIGDVFSATTLAIAPLAQHDKIVLLAPGASNPKMHGIGNYVLRNWTSDEFDGKVMADYSAHILHRTSVSVIFQQTDYTVGLAQAFKNHLQELGGTVSDMEAISNGAPEARQVVAKILQASPSTVYVCATSREAGITIKDLRESGYKGLILSNLTVESPEFMQIAKAYSDGVVYSTPAFDPKDKTPRVQQFAAAYRIRYKSEPDVAAGTAYDAVYLMAEAVRQAHSTDPAKVSLALHAIHDFPGVTGNTTFDRYGDVNKDILIKRISGGVGVIIRRYRVS